jgi:hypothetical protein
VLDNATSRSTAPTAQSHADQGRMIRRYITWRNRNTCDHELKRVIDRANVC